MCDDLAGAGFQDHEFRQPSKSLRVWVSIAKLDSLSKPESANRCLTTSVFKSRIAISYQQKIGTRSYTNRIRFPAILDRLNLG